MDHRVLHSYLSELIRDIDEYGPTLRTPVFVSFAELRGAGADAWVTIHLSSPALDDDQLLGYRIQPWLEGLQEVNAVVAASHAWLDIINEIEPGDSQVTRGSWTGVRWVSEDFD